MRNHVYAYVHKYIILVVIRLHVLFARYQSVRVALQEARWPNG